MAGLTGLYSLCGAITMFFAAFTSAMIVRRGLGADWTGIPTPPILWLNTTVLIASSVLLQIGWRATAAVLGVAFFAGQVLALREVAIALAPGNSFFWVFVAAHAAHVLGGIFALRFARAQLARIYWHFLAGLWLYLILLFTLWGNR